MSTRGVYFRVLGPLEVSVDGIRLKPPRSRVLQGLLGALLLAQGEPLATARLTRLVWGDRAEATSRESVHVGVSRLRKWLRQYGGRYEEEPAIHYADGYLLTFPATCVDLCQFRDLTERARSLTAPMARSLALGSAMELRRGPILAGIAELDRSDALVRAAQDDVREAIMDFAHASLRAGTPRSALPAVGSLAGEHPFDEPVHAALIDLLAACGRPAEALQVYRRLSERLGAELGVEPSGKVQQAHLRVLSADHSLAPGAAVPARDVPVPAQLPPDVPDFTGRPDEVALLTRVLARRTGGSPPTVAVATITGMGGVGKTALAVHVAHRLAGAFPDGRLYADLRGGSGDPTGAAEVLGRFLRAFGTSDSAIPESLDERTALYRSWLANRRTLVVLDNVASEEQVRPLLPSTPEAAVLITSRNRLSGLEGATLLDLGLLPTSQAVALIGCIAGEGRVAVERDSAREIARLCGHVPLAVRIAAARLLGRPHWTLAHLVDLLREERRRLDELAIGDLEVRAGFELSYQRLPATARRALRLTGTLYARDFAAWTVAALLDVPPDEAQRALESLIDAHLVSVVGADATGRLRYRMHDLLRLYARERAEAEEPMPERAAALGRALGAWLSLADEAGAMIQEPRHAVPRGAAPRWRLPAASVLGDPVRWFAAERAALAAGVRQACDWRLDEPAWEIAAALGTYCDLEGMHEDWRHVHERALRLCRGAGNRRGEAVLLRVPLDAAACTPSDGFGHVMDRTRRLADGLLGFFGELGDRIVMADAMVAAVWGLAARGQEPEALASAEKALRAVQRAGRLDGVLLALEREMEVAGRSGDRRHLVTVMQFLGVGRALCGDAGGGRELLEDALGAARDLGDHHLETPALLCLAKLLVATGDARARPAVESALAHCRAGNREHHLADALVALGELNLAEGEAPAAVACLEGTVRLWRGCGWTPHLARTLRVLGDAHAAAADHDSARAAWAEADRLLAPGDLGDSGEEPPGRRRAGVDLPV